MLVKCVKLAFPAGSVVKNPPAMRGVIGDAHSIPGSGGSPGGGRGNLFQYSCLESPKDRGAWQATQSIGSQSQTNWSDLACIHITPFIVFPSYYTHRYIGSISSDKM